MSSIPSSPDVNVVAAAVTPTDRVRWPAIFAGLFAALSTLIVLSTLGVAIMGSTYDPGDPARWFGIGAGIWSAISALIAFFVGGMVAARTAALRGEGTGVLNGAMVWVVAIPLILWLVLGGLGALFRTTAQTAAAGAGAAASAIDRRGDDRDRTLEDQARTAGAQLQATTQRVTQAAQDPENQRKAARATAKTAWGTLVSLVLGLAAAAAGGYFGSSDRHRRRGHTDHRTDDRAPAADRT